jgi:hypothetical protein
MARDINFLSPYMLYRITYHKKIVVVLITSARVFIFARITLAKCVILTLVDLLCVEKTCFLTEANFEPCRKNAVS